MIRMICGATRIGNELKTCESGPFTADPAEEAALISAGVAVRVEPAVATARIGAESNAASVNLSLSEMSVNGSIEAEDSEILVIEDGHYTVDSLMNLTGRELKEMAENLGLNVSKCRNKTEIAKTIATVEVAGETDDGEKPPVLGAEDPVV